jgi:photosystem II stability/assembly factor-like uncharacterized protein
MPTAARNAAALALLFGVAGVVAGCGRAAHRQHKQSSLPSIGGVAVQDLSWRSSADGWALAAAKTCRAGSCARLLHTTNGGHRWNAVPIPSGVEISDGAYACQKHPCVSAVSFTDATVGYLYGPGLLMTTNSGRSWRILRGREVETLSVIRDRVYRVAYQHTGCPGPCQPALQEAAIGSTRWRTLIGKLATPDRSGSTQIVGSGPTVLLTAYGSQAGPVSARAVLYRSSDAGTSWVEHDDPCSGRGPRGAGEEDLIALTSSPGGFFAGLCTPHTGAPKAFVVTSTNGGATWKTGGALPPVRYPALLAAASDRTLAISTGPTGGSGPFTAKLLLSTNGGQSWHQAATDPQHLTSTRAPAWLGFQTPRIARWIGDPSSVWTTLDGGAHWTPTAIR